MVVLATPVMADSVMLVMEDMATARGLLTPRPTTVESDTPAMVDSAMLDTEDTATARGLLTPRPTTVDLDTLDTVDSAMLVLDTDTLDKFCIRKYCGELQTLKLQTPQNE